MEAKNRQNSKRQTERRVEQTTGEPGSASLEALLNNPNIPADTKRRLKNEIIVEGLGDRAIYRQPRVRG